MHSARRGRGSDVAGSRPYVPGDDVKAIDWGASARLSSARGSDHFILRERYAEEAPRVVVIADRRPDMQLFPPGLPWLGKAEAQRTAIELIRASTVEAHGFLGYLDFGDGGDVPFWLPPQSQSLWEYQDREEEGALFLAPASNVEDAFEFLMAHPRSVPAGTFLFVLSDFLVPPSTETWLRVLELRWDVIPVVLQDPLWERSFPPVDGFRLEVTDTTGRREEVRLHRGEAAALQQRHEERWQQLLEDFARAALDPVLVDSSDESELLGAFLDWAETREASVDGLR
ncbi:MAG: DUF58 domain-containing protein [Actinobacteria bacterium]|nr:MAG: DUF58 domain-containing protein [Actinomycetota bacterium]